VKREDQEIGEGVGRIVRLLGRAYGLNIAPYDATFVLSAANKRMAATGVQSLSAYCERLKDGPEEVVTLYRSLRIGYSEFFRNPLAFALLEQVVLPSLVAEKERSGRGELRVWSAGCASGQEAWSAAMLLDELISARSQPVSYRIIATDLSEDELSLARAGVYSAEAVETVRLRHLRTYFSPQGESFAVTPRLRAQVDFSTYDLLDEGSKSPAASIYGDFDLVFCCNLLFYYQAEIQQFILGKLCGTLSDGGFLVTGETERAIVARQKWLRAVAPPAAVFQKKGKQ
jgi:chemotaxis methyl-accepting protein methylase